MTDRPIFLMTDPSHFAVVYRINPWMDPEAWNADTGRCRLAARQASDALRQALTQKGACVEMVPAVPNLPDLVFPANAAVVLDGRALPARFRHGERQGEEPVFRAAFESLLDRGVIKEIVSLPNGIIQEGAGDCIWDGQRGFFWAGYGQRSTAASLAAIESAFAKPVVGLELASPRFYHLDTCFCPLPGGQVLIYSPAFTAEALAKIRSQVPSQDLIEAGADEAAAFCVNAVAFDRHVIMAKAPPSLWARLTGLGYSVTEIDLSPFILSGGGAYCMTLRLDRRSQSAQIAQAAE